MSATCEKCSGTGASSNLSYIYDCQEPGCTSAVDRSELEAQNHGVAYMHPLDALWLGYIVGTTKVSSRQTYWNNVAAGLVEVKTAAERAAEDRHHKPHAVYVEQEVAELRARVETLLQAYK